MNTFLPASDPLLREPITELAFPPWRAIGWFNTRTTGKRRQAANCGTESFELRLLIPPLVLKKMTAASSDQRAIYDCTLVWGGCCH